MAEVLDAGPDRPRWSRRRRLVVSGALVVAVVGAIVTAVARRPDDAAVPPSGRTGAVGPTPSSQPSRPLACDGPAAGPATATAWSRLSAVALGRPEPGGTLTRSDRLAARGPWSVVVRRRDGSLARHGAVVTFPVAPVSGRPVAHGRLHGTAAYRQVVWPVAGSHARVRGDLSVDGLLAVADRTSVVRGRPVVRPLRGYVVTAPLPYRPREVHEVRYRDRGGLGAYGTRLGFVYTGVVRAGGMEDQLYVQDGEPAGPVHGRAALVSTLMGGNATVAWSPAPGVVAYVGYSGVAYDSTAKAALTCLANRSRPMGDAEWRATRPTVVPQRNEVG